MKIKFPLAALLLFTACGGDEVTEEITVNNNPTPVLQCPDEHHPHAIDLGLPSGTKWACCNVDAQSPQQYGGYYAWGELKQKTDYGWGTYAHVDMTTMQYAQIGTDIAGTQYDVAHSQWGTAWQIPTQAQMQELKTACTQLYTSTEGIRGMRITGPNGASIFLPSGGYKRGTEFYNEGSQGFYWASATFPQEQDYAAYLNFRSGTFSIGSYYRCSGLSIRPVLAR